MAERPTRLGRLSCLERIARFFGEESYEGQFVSEGLWLGVGITDGRRVHLVASDSSHARGALTGTGARAAAQHVRDAAVRGAAFCWLIDSDGAVVDDLDSVAGTAELLRALADASGRVPLLAACFGVAGGAAGYALALCDLACALEQRSFVFIAGPDVVSAAIGERSSLDELGSTKILLKRGTVASTVSTDAAALTWLRTLLGFLPDASKDGASRVTTPRLPANGALSLPHRSRPYESALLVDWLLDAGSFFPLYTQFGASTEVGFGRLDGISVGLVSSNTRRLSGALDADSSQKVARFVRLCGAFGVPIVTLCDTPGFLPGRAQEQSRLLVHGAKVISAYAEASAHVPTASVVIRRAVGAGAVLALGSMHRFKLPGAEIVQMGSEAGHAAYGRDVAVPENLLVEIEPSHVRDTLREIVRQGAPPLAPGHRRYSLIPL
jgi:propionyl-CoA carboxylase beta chain